ncbi:MAG: nitrilase-related carbon-nitrogen hydrolase [bacterium]|jgi:predicted amidohydrolase|nr:nitrilase-related carbon-nitrogen hydrolase [bacterium]
MRVAIIQNNPVWGEKEKNINELIRLMNKEKADIYILPEMAYTGYQITSKEEIENLADTIDSENISRFAKFSKEQDCAVIVGFPEKAADGHFYNSSVMITPEGDKHIYRKTHLFYKEKLFFAPGNTGFNVHEWRGVKIGLAICFDWYFSESFRTLALIGADIIAHCSNLVMPYCQTVDYARAIENRVYIATANRIGSESRDGEMLTFTGQSVLVSPKGEYLIKAPAEETGCFTAQIDTNLSRNKKLNEFNDVLADRRELFYRDHPVK